MLSIFRKPIIGRRIRITWLPRSNGERNCYIGSEGIITELNKDEFLLRMDTAWLCGSGRRWFCWRYI